EGERRLQNVSASGNVKFHDRAAGLEGACARLEQRTADGVMELIGEPLCRVKAKGSEIEAPRLVLKGGRLEAWDPGRMTLLGPAEGGAGAAPRKVEVSWKGRMSLAREEGQAEFRGGVVFRDGAAEVSCETLRAEFDAKEGKARRVEARGGVAFKSAEGEGTGERLLVNPEGEAFELYGRPARLSRGGQKFEGDEVRVDRKTGVVASDKPGVMTADAAAMGMEAGSGGVTARWGGSLRYWTQDQRVVLKKDVKLEMGGQTMEGQEIELRRGDNVVIGRGPGVFASSGSEGLGAAQGRWGQSMTYLMDKQAGTLRGGVALETGGQRLEGEEVQFSRKDNTVTVRRPG
ncbi:MAG TPA: LptA/OstA family protein, partial [Candidatus Brocadiia bacterium]|nr:LptA/OstA family protein [Candidatus Brocadiia bacterium]